MTSPQSMMPSIRTRYSRWMCLVLTSCWMAVFSGTKGLAADAEAKLRVLTYNIHHGEGTDRKIDYRRLSEMISSLKPDVVALQEVDVKTSRVDGVDQATLLGEMTAMNVVFGAAMPFSGGHYGEAILSRYPISEERSYPLPFNFGQEPRAVLRATIEPDNGVPEFVFLGTHLCHQSEENRLQQVKELRRRAGDEGQRPVILAGDFNARPGSMPMKSMLGDEWIDATAPQSVIDYVLIQKSDRWKVTKVTTVDDLVVSDHRPVLVELTWVSEEAAQKEKTPTSIAALEELESNLQKAIASVEKSIVSINGGMGGGVLVSPDGYVLTAAHVSGYGRELSISIADGARYPGKSLGAYRFADTAMVKFDGEGPFSFVPMADIGETRVGDWCFALGHPGGLDDKRGVVARLGRVISKSDNLLRSDCKIIGGDSGCALFNLNGELIGIHSRIGRPLDQNYHAPIDAIRRHWDAMKAGDVIPSERMRGRGGFGVSTMDANPGVRVVKVHHEGSPLRKGDVIRQFDDHMIEDDWEYLVAMSSRKIDETVRLRVRRQGEWIELDVKVEQIVTKTEETEE